MNITADTIDTCNRTLNTLAMQQHGEDISRDARSIRRTDNGVIVTHHRLRLTVRVMG